MRKLTMLIVACGLLAGAAPVGALEVGETAKAFRLQGHNGKWYTLGSFKKRIFAIWYEGKNSTHQNKWLQDEIRKLRKAGIITKKNYDSIGIANYQETAIPNAIIDMFIRGAVEKNPGVLVLKDKDGTMQRLYGMRNGRSNIYVFDAKRRLIWKSSGPLSRRRAKQFIRLIRRITR